MAAKLSALQLFFALTWVVYVIYLPALAAQAGIDKRYVPWILMMDQAIFIACDWAAGVYADRVGSAMKRIGEPMALAALASCAAFVALPFVAPLAGPAVFLALTAFWSATSSALRAPPMALVSRHLPEERQPWIAGLYLLGLGVATGLAPFIGLALKGVDPRLPFAAASIVLALFALSLAQAERRFEPKAPSPQPTTGDRARSGTFAAFALAVFLAAIGFQIHFSINSSPGWLRVAPVPEVPWLMPLFWLGFNLAVLPATLLPKRFGGARVMVVAAAVGSVLLAAHPKLRTLEGHIGVQLMAGAAWAVALTAAFSAALEAGRPGREGLMTGVLFSMLAAAALARLSAVGAGVQSGLAYAPAIAWALAAAVVALLVATRRVASETGS